MNKLLIIMLAFLPMMLSAQVKKLSKKSPATDVTAFAEAKANAGAVDEAISILNEYGPKMKTDLDKAILKTSLSMIYRQQGDYENEKIILLEGVSLLKNAIANKSYDTKKFSESDIEASLATYQTELCSIAIAYDSLDEAERYINESLSFYKKSLSSQPAYNYYISLCQGYLARIAMNKGMNALAVIYNSDSYSSLVEYTKQYPTQGDNVPLVSGLLYSIAVIHREVGNYANAIELINKGIKLGSTAHLPGFYDELGVIYLKMNNFPAAQTAYKKVLEISPDYYDTHYMSDLRFIFQSMNKE